MPQSKVAILRTTPATVRRDYHELLNLADYQETLGKDADTALKINISWHFFFPGSSTTPCTASSSPTTNARSSPGCRSVPCSPISISPDLQ